MSQQAPSKTSSVAPRLGLSLEEFQWVAQELKRLEGARVQKVHVPSHRSAFLDLRLPGQSALLLLSAEAEDMRLGVVRSRPTAPPQPLAFQGLLRSHLSGSRLETVRVAPQDRWLRLEFSTPKGQRVLVLELLGNISNLMLLDPEDRILGFGLPSLRREGLAMRGNWSAPPLPETGEGGNPGIGDQAIGKAIDQAGEEESGTKADQGIERKADREPVQEADQKVDQKPEQGVDHDQRGDRDPDRKTGQSVDQIRGDQKSDQRSDQKADQRVDQEAKQFTPNSLPKRLQPFFDPNSDTLFPISAAIEALFSAPVPPTQLRQLRERMLAPLNSALKRAQRTLAKVEGDARRADKAEDFRNFGELLKTQLHTLRRGDKSALLVDWSSPDQAKVEVPLDPTLSPKANMERYFHQHQRLSRNRERIEQRLEEMRQRVARLRELQDRAKEGDEAQIEELLDLARNEGLLRGFGRQQQPSQGRLSPRSKAATPRQPYREYRSQSGLRIRVGKNARDNDELTLRHSRGTDLWLHARSVTGSHVLITGAGPSGPDNESILDAATLAAHFSEMRGETLVEVTSTQARYVRKPKGSPPGLVRYSHDKTILIRLEAERLARVLASEEG